MNVREALKVLIYLVKASVEAAAEEQKKGLYPPLGIMYLSAVARSLGAETRVFDLELDGSEELINAISSEEPCAVGFSVVTQNYYATISLVKKIKRIWKETLVFVGGPHVTLVPQDFQGTPVDVVVVGEGESALPRVLELIGNRAWGARDALRNTPIVIKGELVRDVDSIPLPDRDSLDVRRYGENAGTLFTSRGCPYNCLFCATRFIMGRRFRARSPSNVLREWRILKKKYNVCKVRILDDVFTYRRERALEIMKAVEEEGLGPWSLPNGVRVDNVDEKILDAMSESRCTTVWYGAESGDQKVVNTLRKGIRLERVEWAVKQTKDRGINVGLFFMVGAPGETLSSVRMTIDFINRVEPDFVHFSIATPYPNTDFWRWVEEHGRFLTRDYRLFEKTFIFETPEYPLRDRLKAIEMISKELGLKYDIDFD